jgi:hypothetical protein
MISTALSEFRIDYCSDSSSFSKYYIIAELHTMPVITFSTLHPIIMAQEKA